MPKKFTIVSLFVLSCLFPHSAKCESLCSTLETKNIQFDYQENRLKIFFQVEDLPLSPINAFLKPDKLEYSRLKIPEMDIAEDIVVYKNFAFVAGGYQGIFVFDVTDVEDPTLKKNYKENDNYIRQLYLYKPDQNANDSPPVMRSVNNTNATYLFATNYTKRILRYRVEMKYTNTNTTEIFLNDPKELDFTNCPNTIIDIAIKNDDLLIKTTKNQCFSIELSRCIGESKSLSLAEVSSVDDDMFNIQKNTTQENVVYQIISTNQETSDRELAIINNENQKHKLCLLKYPLKSVRGFDVYEDKVYIADGFNGIAIAPDLIYFKNEDIDTEDKLITFSIYNETIQKRINSKKPYSLMVYDLSSLCLINNFAIQSLEVSLGENRKSFTCKLHVSIEDDENNPFSSEIESCKISGQPDSKCSVYFDKELGRNVCFCHSLPKGNYDVKIHLKDQYIITKRIKLEPLTIIYDKIVPVDIISDKPQAQTVLSLNSGWNPFVFPVQPDKNSMNRLLKANVSKDTHKNTLYYFDYTTQSYILYKTNQTIHPGTGYWIQLPETSPSPTNITLTGADIQEYRIVYNMNNVTMPSESLTLTTLDKSRFTKKIFPSSFIFIGSVNVNQAELRFTSESAIGGLWTFDQKNQPVQMNGYLLDNKKAYWLKVLGSVELWVEPK